MDLWKHFAGTAVFRSAREKGGGLVGTLIWLGSWGVCADAAAASRAAMVLGARRLDGGQLEGTVRE